MNQVIVDASIVVGWFFKTSTQADEHCLAIYESAFSRVISLYAPDVLAYEAAYVLLKRGRRIKTPSVKISEMGEYIDLYVSKIVPQRTMFTVAGITRFAYQYNVQGYDSQYLAAALETGYPVATLDKGLASACKRAGIALYSA